jgi:hypothetical protein
MNKAIVELSDLRTDMESVKWDNMRKSVGMCTISQLDHAWSHVNWFVVFSYSGTFGLPSRHSFDNGTASEGKAFPATKTRWQAA